MKHGKGTADCLKYAVGDLWYNGVAVRLQALSSPFRNGDSVQSFGKPIIDAYLVGDNLLVRGPKHRMLHVPLDSLPALRGRPRAAIRNFTIDADGSFIYWPDLDVHLGWTQFLQAVDPAELRKAQQRSADFNRRNGAAIRKLREEAGIRQASVGGLTERQFRRIEQGECRATTGALKVLAKAHGLAVNAYME